MYVRETWSEWTDGYVYKAWISPFPQPGCYPTTTWHPSIHMPKEAARIWIKVKDVRVERLQKMDSDDFLKEGMTITQDIFDDMKSISQHLREKFIPIWNSTIKKTEKEMYVWDANPWVWVIEFERCEKPEN